MNLRTAIALVFAAAATTLANLAYLREHDAAAALPWLSMRRRTSRSARQHRVLRGMQQRQHRLCSCSIHARMVARTDAWPVPAAAGGLRAWGT